MHKLRLGVIGAGAWAVTSHLPKLMQRADEVEFVAVSRKGSEQLDRVQQRFDFAIASEEYSDVLDAGIDLCVVASPSGLHHEHAKAALEAGAHVLVEKPFTIDPDDAWDLVDAAARAARHVVVAFGWNYNPMVRQLKGIIDEHGIGDIELLTINMASTTRELLSNTGGYPELEPDAIPEQATWTDPALSGGGYGQAQLSHALGIALWLTGLRGQEVFALMSNSQSAAVELHDGICVRYDNGAVGTISGGSAHLGANKNKHQVSLQAIGSEGQLELDLGRERVYLWRHDGVEINLPVRDMDGAYDCTGPPDALVDLALGCVEVNPSPGELGARTVELLAAAYRSAASTALVAVTPSGRAGSHRA